MNLEELQPFMRIVLVTGGTGVLGLEIVRTLVEHNANGVILSRNQERAAKSVSGGV